MIPENWLIAYLVVATLLGLTAMVYTDGFDALAAEVLDPCRTGWIKTGSLLFRVFQVVLILAWAPLFFFLGGAKAVEIVWDAQEQIDGDGREI